MIIQDNYLIPIRAKEIQKGFYIYRKDSSNNYELIIMNIEAENIRQMQKILSKLSQENRLFVNKEAPGKPITDYFKELIKKD